MFATRYTSVLGNAQFKATMIYRECYALLRFSRDHASSLISTLGVLNGVSHALSLFASCPPQPTSGQLQQDLGQLLDRTLDLLNCMTSYFQDLSVGSSNVAGPARLRHSLGKPLEAFDHQADQLLNQLWTYHIPTDIQESSVQFKQVQLLLQPQDEVVRMTQKILLAETSWRHEFTCEWFSQPFLDFVQSSDSALWIDGRTGCGKSVLYGWILESLQSPVDGREYAVVAYSIDPRLPSETKITSVIKALLRQLIERQYRSGKLYQALTSLVSISTTSDDPNQIENAVWESLEVAISEAKQPTMLVIDGVSELDGGEAAATVLFENLLRSTANNPLVRIMVLSRPFTFSPGTSTHRRTIEAKDVHKDICKVITDLVPAHSPIPGAEVARRIDHEADGNFFWSLLALQEWTAQKFSQQVLRTLPVPLEANVVSKIDFLDSMTCTILFNSIIATRPLRLVELEVISRLDVNNRLLKPQTSDMSHVIEKSCGSVLVVQDGIVLFRHGLLKQALLDVLRFGDLLLSPEMHADMACRLLLYLKLVLGQHPDLTLKPTPSLALEDLFQEYPLLSYALRYWPKHVVASSMFPEPGSFKPNCDLVAVFPDTVHAAIIEASFWRRDSSHESVRALQIATHMRKEILGEHEATLQTFACIAEALRLRKDFTGATNYFYMASEIAQVVLPEFHPFTATCMLNFLDVVDDAMDGEFSVHSSQKTNVLRYIISMYDTQIGPSSDQAIEARNLLGTHYTTAQEHTSAAEMYQTLHRLIVDRYGKDSSHARGTAEKLVTAIQYQSEEGAIPYGESVYDDILQAYNDILQAYDVTDSRRIRASIAKAEAYKSLEDPFNAELIYVNLWHGLAEACHRQRNVENHEKVLQCGLPYSRFLREKGRISDSQSVVLGLWNQQQALGYHSPTISGLLREVAMEMKHCGLQDMALDVLYSVLAYSEIQDTDSVRKAISDTTSDMMRDAQSNSSSETALRRILEVKKSQGITDAPTMNALIHKLLECGRFDDVVSIGTEALHQLWPSVLDDSNGPDPVNLDPFDSELATLATNLAQAYSRTNQIELVGPIYWHLFQKARKSDVVDDSTAVGYADLALTAFEQTGQDQRMITLRENILDFCVVRFGERHSKTIEARYALASLYYQERLLDKAQEQYLRICNLLKQPHFHEVTALPALRRLIEIYSREKRWDEAQIMYADLWETLLSKGLEYGFNPSTSKALYAGYATLLKKQDPVDMSRTHGISEQYRSFCSASWGDRNSFTMEAILLLAESELSLHPDSIKAIRLYESLVDGEDGISPDQRDAAKATIEAAENRLVDFYQAMANDGRHNNPNAIEWQGKAITRAIRLLGKKYQREKTRLGASQPATLSYLATLVTLLTKQGARSVAIKELQHAINSVMDADVQPSYLYNAAVILATSFSANGFAQEGLNTVRELTEHVLYDEGTGSYQHARSSLVFLTAFEAHLTESTVDFAEVHATFLKESALWDHYQRLNQTGTDPQLTLTCGARLRNFLIDRNRLDRASLVEGDLYNRFLDDYGAAFAQGIQTARDFFSVLLEELSSERLQTETPEIQSVASIALYSHASSLLDEGEYMAALNLVIPGFEFLRFVGAFANGNNSTLESALRLGLMLAVQVDDPDVGEQMTKLSETILKETFQQCRSQNFDISLIPIEQASRTASVLGFQENYEDLEVKQSLLSSLH